MAVQAKMVVSSVLSLSNQETVTLIPVYSSDPDDPNKSFSDATPSGEVKMVITAKGALGVFKPGATYLIDFTEVTT